MNLKVEIQNAYYQNGGFKGFVRLGAITGLLGTCFFLGSLCEWIDISDISVKIWISQILCSLTYSLSITSFMLILPSKISRLIFVAFSEWTIFITTVACFTKFNFNRVFAGETISILLGSSWEEILEFIGHYLNAKWILIFFLFVALNIIIVRLLWRCKYYLPSKGLLIIFFALLIPYLFYNLFYIYTHREIINMNNIFQRCTIRRFTAINVWSKFDSSLAEIKDLKYAVRYPDLPECLIGPSDDVNLFGIVVIGESATRNRWSLYGYSRPTTPCIDALKNDVFVFTDLLAAAPYTTQALRFLLTEATLGRDRGGAKYTLSQICCRAKYASSFFSMQNHWSGCDGADTLFFSDCSTKVWVTDLTRKEEAFDDKLLPYVASEIKCHDNRAVFLHFMGSHTLPERRYPHEKTVFGRIGDVIPSSEKISNSDHYDNSIHFTDSVLGKLIEMCSKSKRPCFLLYISDHGETPSSDFWRYNSHRDLWEIPMFIWLSKEYKARYPSTTRALAESCSKPLQSDQLLHGIVNLFQITPPITWRTDENFLSRDFKIRENREKWTGMSISK